MENLKDYDWREDPVFCNECRFFNLIADYESEKGCCGKCPNIDYTKYWRYEPWFVSHCTGEKTFPCQYFLPNDIYKWRNERFTTITDWWLYNILHRYNTFSGNILLHKAGNRDIAYSIHYRDWYYGTYLNDDGTLKYYYKMYYVRNRKTPTGYSLVREYTKYDKPSILEKTCIDMAQEAVNRTKKKERERALKQWE